MLREAWYRVQRGGKSAGVDGMSVDVFRPLADRRLGQLRTALSDGTYQPSPVKRIQIAKPAGGWRLLGVPTVTDRILQTAAALVLNDRVALQFSDRSFAYRPFLGPRRAAVFLRGLVTSGAWVVTADIEKFFDNVEHRILGEQLRNVGIDDGGIRLISSWLLAPAQEQGRWFQPVKGLPQGAPVSPVLANLYLTGFDSALEGEGFTHVRYADDFVVVARDRAHAEAAFRYLSTYLGSRLRLRIKPAKTQLAPAGDSFTFVGYRFTPETWTVPAASIQRFQDAVRAMLNPAAGFAAIPDTAKSHNDLVRGWRHFYFGNSPEMDRQLTDLDGWRRDACAVYLAAVGLDAAAAGVWFEKLADHPVPALPSGAYEPADNDRAGEPPAPTEPEEDEWRTGAAGTRPRRARVFSTERQIRDALIGARQSPVLLEDGSLRIPTHGGFVSRSRSILTVRRKAQTIFECAFEEISSIAIEGVGVVLSTTVIDECQRRAIPLAICRISGKPIARLLPARSPLEPGLVRRQLIAHQARAGTPLVTALLRAKLSNQRALLLYHRKYRDRDVQARDRLRDAAVAIAACLPEIDDMVNVPMRLARRPLFLIEARAAAYYWRAFAALIPRDLRFERRVHRSATDVVNKALNYGYALLLNRVWMAVYRSGLEPTLGLLHTGRHRSAGLVFDLMEPFRQPVVDRAVLALAGRKARLRLNQQGDLTIRTRALVEGAVGKRLESAAGSHRGTLLAQIQRRTTAFKRALVEGTPYQGYRMTW